MSIQGFDPSQLPDDFFLDPSLSKKEWDFSGDTHVLAWVVLDKNGKYENTRGVKYDLIIATDELKGRIPIGLAPTERPRIFGIKKNINSGWGEKAEAINQFIKKGKGIPEGTQVFKKNMQDINTRMIASFKKHELHDSQVLESLRDKCHLDKKAKDEDVRNYVIKQFSSSNPHERVGMQNALRDAGLERRVTLIESVLDASPPPLSSFKEAQLFSPRRKEDESKQNEEGSVKTWMDSVDALVGKINIEVGDKEELQLYLPALRQLETQYNSSIKEKAYKEGGVTLFSKAFENYKSIIKLIRKIENTPS